MNLRRSIYTISTQIQQMNEYKQAHSLISHHSYSEAHGILLRLIQILKPHGELSGSLLKMAFENAKKVGVRQQNEILQHNLNTLGNILQYLQNNVFYDPHYNEKLLSKYDRQFIGHKLYLDFKRVEAYNAAILEQEEGEKLIMDLIQYSEQQFQKERTLLDIAILKWLYSGKGYNPSIFNAKFPQPVGQVLLDTFQNAEAKLDNTQPIEFGMKFFKAYIDFIISGNVHLYNRTIVGKVFEQYLKYSEKKCKDQVYKPLLGLAWLYYQEERYLSSEGLMRTIYDQLQSQQKKDETKVLIAQYMHLNGQLMNKLQKRQTEVEQSQNYLKQFKMPSYQQKGALYFYLPDHAVYF